MNHRFECGYRTAPSRSPSIRRNHRREHKYPASWKGSKNAFKEPLPHYPHHTWSVCVSVKPPINTILLLALSSSYLHCDSKQETSPPPTGKLFLHLPIQMHLSALRPAPVLHVIEYGKEHGLQHGVPCQKRVTKSAFNDRLTTVTNEKVKSDISNHPSPRQNIDSRSRKKNTLLRPVPLRSFLQRSTTGIFFSTYIVNASICLRLYVCKSFWWVSLGYPLTA